MPQSIRAARRAALAALLFSAACTDRLPTEVTPPPADGGPVRTEIACTVTVAEARMRCDVPVSAGGASAAVLLGGQGTYVRLESANLAYDATSDVFSMDVSVQNLLSQQMGTPDGVTATGVKVFFEQMPVASEGSGDVTVLNADGQGSFTGMSQPYFAYPEILEARGTSAPKPWRFGVPGTVQRFGFKVYVSTELPAEQGVLRWQYQHGMTSRQYEPFASVWGVSRDLVYAVGGKSIYTFNRATDPTQHFWSPMVEAPATLTAIWGTSRSNIWVSGDSGVVMRYDGNRWTVKRAPSAPDHLTSVWSDGGDAWAVGRRLSGATDVDGLLLHSGDAGESWTETVSAGAGKRYLRDVAGAGDRLYAVGYEDPAIAGASPRLGVLLRSADGGQTWSDSLISGLGSVTLNAVWADGPLDVYIGGETTPPGGTRQSFLLHSTDGGATWTRANLGGGSYVYSIWRIPGGDLLVVGGGILRANDGTGWRELSQQCTTVGAGWRSVWASSLDDVFLALMYPTIFYRQSGCMRMTYAGIDANNLTQATAVSVTPEYGMIAGTQSAVMDGVQQERAVVLGSSYGGAWSIHYSGPALSAFEDAWVQDQYNLIAVGRREIQGQTWGFIMRRANNSFWTDVSPEIARNLPLTAVWRTGNEIYAFGVRSTSPASIVVLRTTNDGATWTETTIPYTGTGTPRITDAWGSSANAIHVSGYAESGEAEESFTLRYDGTSWTLSVAPGDGARLSGVWSSGSTVVTSGYREAGSGWSGFVRTSTDGGFNWTEAALPASSANGRIEGIWGTSPSALYAVGNGGGVYRFDGTAWKSVMRGPTANFLGVGGTSDTNLYAVGEGGAVYHGTR